MMQQFALYRRELERQVYLLLVPSCHDDEVNEEVWTFVTGLVAESVMGAAILYMRSSQGRLAFARNAEESIEPHPLGHLVHCYPEGSPHA